MNALEIKENRKKLNLTQAELAKMVGVTTKTISNYENGEVIPESKKELLLSIFNKESNITLNEPNTDYYTVIKNRFPGSEQKIKQIEEKIRERRKIIELASLENKNEIAKHNKEIIDLLEEQISLIKLSIKNRIIEETE